MCFFFKVVIPPFCVVFSCCVGICVCARPCAVQPGDRKSAAPATRCYRGSASFVEQQRFKARRHTAELPLDGKNLITTTTDPRAGLLGHF